MVEFVPVEGADYKHDYDAIFADIAAGKLDATDTYRDLCKDDLFFLLYFGLERVDVNKPWIVNRIREVESVHDDTLDLWAREHYKAVSNNTQILTPDGVRTHGDIRPGDYVFSPSGEPVMVLAVTGTMMDPEMYELEFQNSQRSCTERIRATSQHLWDVEYFDRRRLGEGRIGWVKRLVMTKEMVERTERAKRAKNPRFIKIKYSEPLRYRHAELPIMPYTLGAWIGDGSGSTITNANDELWDRIRKEGYEVSHDHVPLRENTQRRTVYGLGSALSSMGLYECNSRTKYIPEEYFSASVVQRQDMVQGLMDSDGSVMQRNNLAYTTISRQLAEDVGRLLRTFGIVAHVAAYSCQIKGEDYLYYRVTFVGNDHLAPFCLSRHRDRLSKATQNNYWFITDVKRTKAVPAQCIQVEGGKYVVGENNIPTHNSTIINLGLNLQDIVEDPEVRIGIFSHTRPIAKGFLREIKNTLEGDCPLKSWFTDVFYAKPKAQAPKWSEDDGLVVKRKTKPKESTIEAWGLVDGQPTSKHFTKRVYDDVVTEDGVGNPEQILKTQKAYELSQSLGTDGGSKRVCGTHYHFADLYSHLKKKETYKVREYPATDDGKATGEPVLISKERLAELLREQGSYVFSCQQLLKPIAAEDQVLKPAWLKYYGTLPGTMNKYLLCDPANEKKKKSDYTTMGVIGIDTANNRLLLDLLRDKLNLGERWEALRDMRARHPGILGVGYEKYGKDSDIWYFEQQMKKEGGYFHITPLGGPTGKPDRIQRLVPKFENGQFLLPDRLFCKQNYGDRPGEEVDMIRIFIDEEYSIYPFCLHDDILDMLSRIEDPQMKAVTPVEMRFDHTALGRAEGRYQTRATGWMAS